MPEGNRPGMKLGGRCIDADQYTRTDPGFRGEDNFTFKANDGNLDGNTATVSLIITGAPASPGPQ